VRWAQLFASSGEQLHGRLRKLSDARALRVASPALSRLRAGDAVTLAATIETSNVPRALLDAPFARAGRFASRGVSAERPPPATEAVQLAVSGFRSGSAAFIPARFTAKPDIDGRALRDVLGDDGIAQQLQQRGVDASKFLTNIEESHRLVSGLASRIDVGVRQLGGTEPSGPLVLRVEHGTHAATRLNANLGRVRELMSAGQVTFEPSVAAELHALEGREGARFISARALEAVNETLTEHPTEETTPLELHTHGVRVVVPRESSGRFSSLLTGAGATERVAHALTQTDALRTAALTSIGVATESAGELVGSFHAGDRETIAADAAALSAALIPADTPFATPPLTRLSTETADHAVAALDQPAAYTRLLSYAHQLKEGVDGLVPPRTAFSPIMAAPQLPEPLVERVRAFDQEWVLGGASNLPPNSICILALNTRFTESLLVGANYEFARELLWRGFPTDFRGSCFRRFWPRPGDPPPDDIRPIHEWQASLGNNAPAPAGGGDLTVVVIKGDLLRRYPSTIVTAEKGRTQPGAHGTEFVNDPAPGSVATELFRGRLDPDISYVALGIKVDVLREQPDWYISLRQPIDEPHFGLDDAEDPDNPRKNREVADPDDWTWEGRPDNGVPTLSPDELEANDNSAVVACNLFQRPFRLLLRAEHYVPRAS
jgi:hypothetical protein